MPDDPSNWELARRLDQIYGSLQAFIARAEYAEYQRSIEHQLTELRSDIQEVRKTHNDYVETSTSRRQWKTLLYTGLIPSLVSIAAILVTIAMHSGG